MKPHCLHYTQWHAALYTVMQQKLTLEGHHQSEELVQKSWNPTSYSTLSGTPLSTVMQHKLTLEEHDQNEELVQKSWNSTAYITQ